MTSVSVCVIVSKYWTESALSWEIRWLLAHSFRGKVSEFIMVGESMVKPAQPVAVGTKVFHSVAGMEAQR